MTLYALYGLKKIILFLPEEYNFNLLTPFNYSYFE